MKGDIKSKAEDQLQCGYADALLIFVCYNCQTSERINPFLGTVPVCDECLSSNCAPIVDERLRPIRANSPLGRELCRQMGTRRTRMTEHISFRGIEPALERK